MNKEIIKQLLEIAVPLVGRGRRGDIVDAATAAIKKVFGDDVARVNYYGPLIRELESRFTLPQASEESLALMAGARRRERYLLEQIPDAIT